VEVAYNGALQAPKTGLIVPAGQVFGIQMDFRIDQRLTAL
jgi:hypothetical protein